MRLRKLSIGLCLPLGIAATFISTSPVEAALVTSCVGTAGAVTVPGDLVVPAGKSCDLSGTTIEGNTTVRPGATLLMDGVSLEGNLIVRADGYAQASDTVASGTIRLAQSFGLMAEDSELGAVTSATGGFFYATSSEVAGNVRSTSAETVLETVVVSGSVTTNGDTLSDLYDSTVTGDVAVTGPLAGSAVCTSEVDGQLSIREAGDIVSIGNPVVGQCGPTYVGGDLVVRDNTGGVYLNGTIVRGSAQCSGNVPAPVGTGNRFRGGATDQCVTLPAARSKSQSRGQQALNLDDRVASIKQLAAERSAAGEAAAAAAGAARIGA